MPTSLPYTQDTFAGGLNLLALDTAIQADQYKIGLNLRTRFGYAKPIRSPMETTEGLPINIPAIQGLYAFGSILVLFAGGIAYFKTSTAELWAVIPDFAMSLSADRMYCVGVPQSSVNYNRKNVGSTPSAGVTLDTTSTTATPVCLIVQDGINQPWLIFADGTARISKTYAQWTTTDREYIPIGKQMVYFDGILFVVSADGKIIYRSVSGRPLDFVVAIDNAADKVSDATLTSFAVDSNEIKLITQLNTDSLIVITAYSAYSVQPDFTNTIYGEPQFSQTFLFSAGVTNQFSFTDILGDFAFIDKEGVKSFNAVSQLRFEGNNGVFSLSVAELFRNITQTDPCVGSFDNYTFFGVKTIYSDNTILVYDNIQKVFVSLDIVLPRPIKQFASTYADNVQKFYVATTNKVYELYSEDAETFEPATLFTRAFDTRNSDLGPAKTIGEVRATSTRLIFEESLTAGEVQVTETSDGRAVSPLPGRRNITALTYGVPYPVVGPCIATVTNGVNNIVVQLNGKQSQRVSFILVWTGGARLTRFQCLGDTSLPPSSVSQQSKQYG